MDYISECLESFLSFTPILIPAAKYGIIAFVVELIRLKCGKKPCKKHWRLVLIGFLSIIALYAFTPLISDAGDTIVALYLLSFFSTALLLWIAVGISAAKLFIDPEVS